MDRSQTRRAFLARSLTAGGALTTMPTNAESRKERGKSSTGLRGAGQSSFLDILRPPDTVRVFMDKDSLMLAPAQAGVWQARDIEVTTHAQDHGLPVTLSAPTSAVRRVHLRWNGNVANARLFLGDHWERGYGDLEWRGQVPERAMPWYFLAHDGAKTHGYGLAVRPGALCFWQADANGISLWADVCSGGMGVQLGARRLDIGTVVCRQGQAGETPYQALHAFCRQMCPNPRLPAHPVYGTNDWYYAYGNNTAKQLEEDCKRLVALSPAIPNRPFAVVDAGWQAAGGSDSGPWDRGNDRFPSMPGLAEAIRKSGARPGIWIRPLAGKDSALPATWKQTRDASLLDPTLPDVHNQVATDIARLRQWGYELIKHDFSTYDILGRWGFQMRPEPTAGNWHFARRTQTNAEIIRDLYDVIRNAAQDVTIIGCNTVSYLSAGVFEVYRVGDDTSGHDWERTRKMGVNSLAFRAAQHNAFYAVDADCVGLTPQVPWELNRQWLDLLARSGTALFVSAQPSAIGPEQEKALRAAFALAAQPQPTGEPLDWLESTCPRKWKLNGREKTFDWFGSEGASPFSV